MGSANIVCFWLRDKRSFATASVARRKFDSPNYKPDLKIHRHVDRLSPCLMTTKHSLSAFVFLFSASFHRRLDRSHLQFTKIVVIQQTIPATSTPSPEGLQA